MGREGAARGDDWVKLIVLPGVGHGGVGDVVNSSELQERLFSQKLPE